LHDERDALPQTVDVSAAEFVGAAEVSLDSGPILPELEEQGAAAGSLEEGGAGGRLDPGGAPGDGECEAALDGVEVCPFGEGELELMAERRTDGRVEQGGGVGLLAGLL
jgi:hypothetical protein